MVQGRASLCRTVFLILLAAAGVQAAQPVALDKDPNLAAWWKFDETAGKIAADASRHSRNGTLKGDLSFETSSVAGKTGKAIKLEGGDGLIEIAGYKGVTETRPRTVAAWIKTETTRGQIISWGTEDFGKMWNFGFIRGRVGVTPHGGYLYMNAETHDNEWHHVAAVVRAAELPNLYDDVTLYLDGAIAEIHDIGLLDLWPLETGNELDVRIGPGFQGCLDDVRIYDRPLSDEEVQVLFRLESNRPIPQKER